MSRICRHVCSRPYLRKHHTNYAHGHFWVSVHTPSINLRGLLTAMLQYTATQAIRRDFEAPGVRNVPIIAMTASAIQGDREKCEASGMNVSGHPFLESVQKSLRGCRIT